MCRPAISILGTIALAMAVAPACAQRVVAAQMAGQPLQYMKGGEVNGCGIRIVGAHERSQTAYDFVDASLNIYADVRALAKMAAYTQALPIEKGKRTDWPLQGGWFRLPRGKAATPLHDKVIPADGPGILFGADPVIAFEFLLSALNGKTVQVAARKKSDSEEFIFAGEVRMSDAERDQFRDCIASLQSAWSTPDGTN